MRVLKVWGFVRANGHTMPKMSYTPVTPAVSIERFLNLLVESDALLRCFVADRWFTTGAQLCRASLGGSGIKKNFFFIPLPPSFAKQRNGNG